MRLLFIATQLPPFNGSGNIRALNYINYLSRLNHQIDVIGVDYPKDSIAYDETLENSFDSNVTVYRINPGLFYKLFYRRRRKEILEEDTKNSISINSSIKGKINYFIRRNFLIPDSFIQWVQPAYKKGRELIETHNYDCIVSLHETPSSHLVAYRLKKDFKQIRWVGYWSDPWNGDSSLRIHQSKLKTLIEEKLEEAVIKNVDKLLFTTEKTREQYSKKYMLNCSKTEIVYRGYDPEKYQEIKNTGLIPEHIKNNKINIIHTGTIYHKLRNVRPLCDALEMIKIENKEIFNLLNVIFLGQFDNIEDQKTLEKISNVKILPSVPYNEALSYMINSNVLILYGNKNSTQIPGKVYEYIGSNAVVLTILGDDKDELKELMQEINKGPIILNDSREIKEEILTLSKMFMGNKFDSSWTLMNTKYKWLNVAKDLERKILF